jgi:hypothetical protein
MIDKWLRDPRVNETACILALRSTARLHAASRRFSLVRVQAHAQGKKERYKQLMSSGIH